jgi:hypothetical protein
MKAGFFRSDGKWKYRRSLQNRDLPGDPESIKKTAGIQFSTASPGGLFSDMSFSYFSR